MWHDVWSCRHTKMFVVVSLSGIKSCAWCLNISFEFQEKGTVKWVMTLYENTMSTSLSYHNIIRTYCIDISLNMFIELFGYNFMTIVSNCIPVILGNSFILYWTIQYVSSYLDDNLLMMIIIEFIHHNVRLLLCLFMCQSLMSLLVGTNCKVLE